MKTSHFPIAMPVKVWLALPVDKTIAYRVIIVIVSESDEWTGSQADGNFWEPAK